MQTGWFCDIAEIQHNITNELESIQKRISRLLLEIVALYKYVTIKHKSTRRAHIFKTEVELERAI